ncbi:hypothetical protein MYX04_10175 [Nitrospiraceae bacterium AH_259_D15_M11_P09]|nr:hypothetical protein [Nitrospiraceae bacterium AH_259_D15_M11_P09]
MAAPKPSLTALLVCDMVIEDKATNKKTLVGLFTDIWSTSFPFTHHKMGVYFCLTDAEGAYDVVLRLVSAESESLIAEAGLALTISDMLAINDFGINLPIVQFPSPGRYEFQLFANKEFLGRKEFRVTRLEAKPS